MVFQHYLRWRVATVIQDFESSSGYHVQHVVEMDVGIQDHLLWSAISEV